MQLYYLKLQGFALNVRDVRVHYAVIPVTFLLSHIIDTASLIGLYACTNPPWLEV